MAPKDSEPRASKDPFQSAQDIAQRLSDDAEDLLTAATEGTQRATDDGIAVPHDVVQASLDSIAILRNKVGLAEQALRDALK